MTPSGDNRDQPRWWRWLDGERSPFLNMAIDETLLFRSRALKNQPLVRVYGWDRPSVSIGYVQTVDAAPSGDWSVVRRPTGGGVVYHDADLTYTVVIPDGHELTRLDRLESYHVLHRAVLRALRRFGVTGALSPRDAGPVDRATMDCFTTPTRYDVVATEDGRKYAGAAQRRTRDGVLHQGSVSRRGTTADREALTRALLEGVEEEFSVTFADFAPEAAFLAEAGELAERKYATDDWNVHRRSPAVAAAHTRCSKSGSKTLFS